MKRKLVRDNIPKLEKKYSKLYDSYCAGDVEYLSELKLKLIEEVNEFFSDESKEEMADVLEVIYSLCDYKGYSFNEIEEIRKAKRKLKGAFKDRIISVEKSID